jgi:hypothetical protein
VAQMPLPFEVGAAIADYLRHASPNTVHLLILTRLE